MYLVSGTQADKASNNKLVAMKVSRLHRTYKGDPSKVADSDEESDESDDEIEEDPLLEFKYIPHHGGVNRIRMMGKNGNQVAATWADTGKVHVWDMASVFKSLDQPGLRTDNIKPVYTVNNHKTEGFAMDWSPRVTGK